MNSQIFSVKGERGTGTRFLRKILNYYFDTPFENIKSSGFDADGYYGWKHGYILEDELNRLNEDNVIVCIINKNIFSWLLSIYTNPFELKNFKNPGRVEVLFSKIIGGHHPFKTFINPKNRVYDKYESWLKIFYEKEGIYDSYSSLYDLRYKKYKSILNKNIGRKIYFRYEDLLVNHYDIVLAVSKSFNLKITKEYNKFLDIYPKRNFYLNKEYMNSYTQQMIKTVEQNIDVTFERRMGYF